MIQAPEETEKFNSLLEIVQALRGPHGCPWDKEQTHRSLTPYAIEEAHELAEAIEQASDTEIVSELGDVLLQVVLHSEIGRQEGRFDISDVIRAISEKMIRRHPHVFSDTRVTSAKEVIANWAEIKALENAHKKAHEKAQKSQQTSPGKNEPPQAKQDSQQNSQQDSEEREHKVPAGGAPIQRFDVPLSLSALSRSQKIGEKTKRLRFDWPDADAVLHKVDEELSELKAELGSSPRDSARLEHELGDLLFSVTQLARHLGLEAEQCLRTANARFEHRYFTMRRRIEDSGRVYDQLTDTELEAAWQETKHALAKQKGHHTS